MEQRHVETCHSFCHQGRASGSCYVCPGYDLPEKSVGIYVDIGGIAYSLGSRQPMGQLVWSIIRAQVDTYVMWTYVRISCANLKCGSSYKELYGIGL